MAHGSQQLQSSFEKRLVLFPHLFKLDHLWTVSAFNQRSLQASALWEKGSVTHDKLLADKHTYHKADLRMLSAKLWNSANEQIDAFSIDQATHAKNRDCGRWHLKSLSWWPRQGLSPSQDHKETHWALVLAKAGSEA